MYIKQMQLIGQEATEAKSSVISTWKTIFKVYRAEMQGVLFYYVLAMLSEETKKKEHKAQNILNYSRPKISSQFFRNSCLPAPSL